MSSENGEPWDVRGKTVLVTGGNVGIGKATATELLRRGADVIFTSRDVARGELALREIREAAGGTGAGTVQVRPLDLASFESIESFGRRFLDELPALHVLVHNAGLIEPERRETADGFELTFGTNHLGPFLLQRLLEARLRESAPARVVVVASRAHAGARGGLDFDDLQSERGYDAVKAYCASKLANVLFANELAKRLAGSGVTANSLHPGVVASHFNAGGATGGSWGFVFKWLRPLLLSPEKGARTSLYLCCAPELGAVSGAYFDGCRERQPAPPARDAAAASRLWEVSEALSEPLLVRRS